MIFYIINSLQHKIQKRWFFHEPRFFIDESMVFTNERRKMVPDDGFELQILFHENPIGSSCRGYTRSTCSEMSITIPENTRCWTLWKLVIDFFPICECNKCYCVFFNDYPNPIITDSNQKGRFISWKFFQIDDLGWRWCLRNLIYYFKYSTGKFFIF